eukprot:223604_1
MSLLNSSFKNTGHSQLTSRNHNRSLNLPTATVLAKRLRSGTNSAMSQLEDDLRREQNTLEETVVGSKHQLCTLNGQISEVIEKNVSDEKELRDNGERDIENAMCAFEKSAEIQKEEQLDQITRGYIDKIDSLVRKIKDDEENALLELGESARIREQIVKLEVEFEDMKKSRSHLDTNLRSAKATLSDITNDERSKNDFAEKVLNSMTQKHKIMEEKLRKLIEWNTRTKAGLQVCDDALQSMIDCE